MDYIGLIDLGLGSLAANRVTKRSKAVSKNIAVENLLLSG